MQPPPPPPSPPPPLSRINRGQRTADREYVQLGVIPSLEVVALRKLFIVLGLTPLMEGYPLLGLMLEMGLGLAVAAGEAEKGLGAAEIS